MSTTAASLETFPLYIGGEFVSTEATDTIRLPYDGSPVGLAPKADAAILARAIDAAREGARSMAALANYQRADLLMRIHDCIHRDLQDFTHLVCSETGKPVKEARAEAERSLQTLLAAAQEARQLHGEAIPMEAAPGGRGRMAMTVREPLGVIGAITPFNVPLNLALHKLAPALAAGNAMVHKPAERTPLSALRLARAVHEAGAPRGAYNVVTGDGPSLGMGMLRSDSVAMITFTGSVAVGERIRAGAGFKPVTLELGNNSAAILEPDADLDIAVPRSVQGSFAHSGQVCISLQRIYVQETIAKEFTDRLVAETSKLRIGHPYEESTDISSLIDETNATRVKEWIDEAVAAGAHLLTGGKRQHATVTPTILSNVPKGRRISCQEVFRPVVLIYTYRELKDAVREVNDTPFGLQAGIFTRDLQRAFQTARELQVGGVLINDVPTFRVDHMPYGGTKHSGLGREGPRYAIEEMTEPKLICWRT